MSFTFQGNRGTNSIKTAGTSIGVSPSQAISAGQLLIATFASDNQGTTQGDTTAVTVSDSQSNTWTRLYEHTVTGGSPGDGATVGVFWSVLTTGLGTGDTVTASHSNVIAKSLGLEEFTFTGSGIQASGANTANGTSDTPSVTLSGLTSAAYLWLGCAGAEIYGDDSITEDADYTGLTQHGTTGGGGASNCCCHPAYRLLTGTSDTYAITLSRSSDWAVGLGVLEETGGATTYEGSWTADAVIQRAQAGSWTADAILQVTQAGSWTADAILQRTESNTWAADAIIQGTPAASWTADAIIQRTQAGTWTADAILQVAQGGSWTVDAWITSSGTVTGDWTADAVIQAPGAGSWTADAIILRVVTGNWTTDAILQRTESGSWTADAVVQRTEGGSWTVDAWIESATVTGSWTVDAIVQRTEGGSWTADAILQRTVGGSWTADAIIGIGVPLLHLTATRRGWALTAAQRDRELTATRRDFELTAARRDLALTATRRTFALTVMRKGP